VFRNYLLVAFRNLKRSAVFSAINILGLVIGMTACVMILHYVNFERSFDRFHANSDRIYRLRYERTDEAGESVRFASCCPPAAARIRGAYPEVENIARIFNYRASVSRNDDSYLEERMFFAEPEFLDILKFRMITGDPLNGIRRPNTMFISQATAKRYFGDEDPIGQTLSLDRKADYTVTGVFENIPGNSHLKFDFLLPWENLVARLGTDYTEAWGHTGSYTYLLTAPGTDPRAFEKRLLSLVEAECPWLKDYNMTIDLKMQPLTDIHLTSHFMQEYEPNGNADSVRVLSLVAAFIMIMAWVNFVNLSTAGSLRRAREVGMRKVVGASRTQLTVQFFTEIIVTNGIALAVTAAAVTLLLPAFHTMTGLPADLPLWSQTWFPLTLGAMFVVGVFLSGLYPVMALSSFRPSEVLKGRLWTSARGITLRKSLVVFQFGVGLVLIIATLTVSRQISFMRNQDLGFDMQQTLVVKAPRVRDESYGSKFETFRETLLQRDDIARMTHVTEVPGRQVYWDAGGIHKAGEDVSQSKNYQIVGIDYEFAGVFDLEFAAGRNFSRDFPSDDKALILNETAARFMGFDSPESAIGQQVDYWEEIFTIVGVLKDYHQQSLKEAYEPHIFRFAPYGRGALGSIAIRTSADHVEETVRAVKEQYDDFWPGNAFTYFFLDDYYNQQYASDELFGRVYGLFTLLAIVIIGMGIFGLSSYSVAQMTKEIGVRKVLGASVFSIAGLLTRELVMLLLIASAIAWPIAFFAMNRWLDGFAYRTNPGAVTFVLASGATLVIALLTVSWQVFKAARANPVKALRYE